MRFKLCEMHDFFLYKTKLITKFGFWNLVQFKRNTGQGQQDTRRALHEYSKKTSPQYSNQQVTTSHPSRITTEGFNFILKTIKERELFRLTRCLPAITLQIWVQNKSNQLSNLKNCETGPMEKSPMFTWEPRSRTSWMANTGWVLSDFTRIVCLSDCVSSFFWNFWLVEGVALWNWANELTAYGKWFFGLTNRRWHAGYHR